VRDALPDYLKGYVTFAYKSGWRKKEISNLTWSQVDQENWIVYLNPGETKNEQARTVCPDEELKDWASGQIWDPGFRVRGLKQRL
jgi:integrase